MAYVRHISVEKYRSVERLEIDLAPLEGAELRHLILTGPNGSGKTSVLEAVRNTFDRMQGGVLRGAFRPAGAGVHVTFDRSEPQVLAQVRESEAYAVFFPARRSAQLQNVSAPNNKQPSLLQPDTTSSAALLQYLVNKKTEQAFAAAEGDHEAVQRIERWFDDVLEKLRKLFGEPDLSWSFDRKTYRFTLRHASGFEHDLTQLADGHAAALDVLSALLLRVEASSEEPQGVVIIDEVEAHLHVGMQEQILPLLTAFFPRAQFLVATHSPAVICSIDGAVVVDLARPTQRFTSEELRGVPYGDLMTSYFGISSDFDLLSTRQLQTLHELARKVRTPSEEARLTELAGELRRRSPVLALRVWEILDGPEPHPA